MTALLELVASQARRCPNQLALATATGTITYAGLERLSDRVAAALLRLRGPAIESVATLLADPVGQAAAFLGVAKAGKRYVPIDPDFPDLRVAFLARDAEAGIAIVDRASSAARLNGMPVLALDQLPDPGDTCDGQRAAQTDDDDLWIVYTSGSTGQPKGLRQTHRNLLRYMEMYRDGFAIRPDDILASTFSLHVNGGLHDLLIALTNGLTLAPWDAKHDGLAGFSRWVLERNATILSMVPTAFRAWMEQTASDARFPGVRLLRLWGEPSFRRDFEWFRRRFDDPCLLVNRLGSSETGPICWNFLHPADSLEGVRIPVGRATPDHTLWVEDEEGNRLGPGRTGEIVVRSAYVFPGYWRREEQTRAVLSQDPVNPGERVYRTGDLGYVQLDGQLVAVGRKGKMVKIRGYLVALDEVEQALASHPAVRDAVVNPIGELDGEQRLVGYYLARDGAGVSPGDLRRHILERLPDHMAPAAFVRLDSFPLAPNGKIARAELPPPPPTRPSLDCPFKVPETPEQCAIAAVWQDVLGVSPVGLDDDFLDLGGTSLRAGKIMARLNLEFGAELPVAALFENPTVRRLARRFPGRSRDCSARDGIDIVECMSEARAPIPPLTRRPGAGLVMASSAQQRLWFLDQLEGPSPVYHVSRAWRLQGPFDAEAWRRALSEVVRRHEALRTTIVARDGVPYQQIAALAPVAVTVRDFQSLPAERRAPEAQAFFEAESRRPFRLDSDLMLRSAVAVLDLSEHLLLIVVHHIACDGWSIDVLVKEAAALYDAAGNRAGACLPDLPVQYADYAEWQRNWLAGGGLSQQLDYWRRRLADVPRLDFPADFPRPARIGVSGAREYFRIPAPVAAAVRQCGQQEGATAFMVTLAAYLALLARYTGSDEIAVGVPAAGRPVTDLEPLIGFFANTLVLRIGLHGDPSFRELIGRTRSCSIEALSNQDIPFERLVEELRPERDPSYPPLFQTLFVLQTEPAPLRLRDTVALPLPLPSSTAKVDLNLILEPEGQGYLGQLEYSTELFRPETARRLCSQYLRLLEFLVKAPDSRIGEAPVLSPVESRQVLMAWNGPTRSYPDCSIAAAFEQRAEESADAVAVTSLYLEWTYADLNRRANRIAHALRAAGVRRGQPVAMLMHRSAESIAAMLGILKSGAGYLPLDPGDPPERLRFQLHDSASPVVVGAAATKPAFDRLGVSIPWIGVDCDEVARQVGSNPEPVAGRDDLAYVNYTSGSTGVPKALMIPHRAVLRLVCEQDYARFGPEETFLHMASLSFDAATLEVWGPLLHGGRCAVWEGPLTLGRDLGEFLRDRGVTTAWLTASLFNAILDEAPEALEGLRQLLTGGEALSLPHIRRAVDLLPGTRIVNGYGPTEATTFTCCHPIPRPVPADWVSVPLGRPIANTEVFVLDRHRRPVPPLVPGELWIGGDGLAIGYLNRPELDAEKFVEVEVAGRRRRLYRSGDRVRWLPSGVLEFLGRFDDQVKIRGHRVELGEIEAALAGHPDVKAACVLAPPAADGTRRLSAFVARRGPAALDARSVAGFLAGRLPAHMVPSEIMVLDELPLSPNGKVNRQALAVPAAPATAEAQPAGEKETRLARLWSRVLGVGEVPRHRSFFDLGGHSLLALKLLAAVEKEFGVRLSVASIFEAPTLAAMAARITGPPPGPRKGRVAPIQPNGALSPFFCVGASPVFRGLAAHLGPDRPFLGLTIPGDPVGAGFRNIEELAADLADVVRTRQPQGPYLLGGWCLAGVLAYEIARQLETAGRQVQVVVLFDTVNPEAWQAWLAEAPRRRWLELMWAKTVFHAGELIRAGPAEMPRRLWTRLRGVAEHVQLYRAVRRGAAGEDDVLIDFDTGLTALTRPYRPAPIRARVVQFRPLRRPRDCFRPDGRGWERTGAQLEVVEVPGDHRSMLAGPEARVLSDQLRRRLEAISPAG